MPEKVLKIKMFWIWNQKVITETHKINIGIIKLLFGLESQPQFNLGPKGNNWTIFSLKPGKTGSNIMNF